MLFLDIFYNIGYNTFMNEKFDLDKILREAEAMTPADKARIEKEAEDRFQSEKAERELWLGKLLKKISQGPHEEVASDENKIETAFNANLLTNYDETLRLMEAIEGPTWLKDQPQGLNVKGSLEYVMNWLKTVDETSHATTLYGWMGGDRYSVKKDGSVTFKTSFSIARTLSIAKVLNFPLEN
jgi:hypothetical protein